MIIPNKIYPTAAKNTERYASLRSSLTAAIKRGMKRHKVAGMSVLLVDDSEIVWAQGFGYADIKRKRLADVNTIYKSGSITKVFTACAIMQLLEAGKIDLDAPIQEYLPELKIRYHQPTTKPITIRSIMSHTSGLPVDALRGMFNRHPESFYTAIDHLNSMHAAYAPGTIATYSNLGMDLLGVVIERVSGLSYAEYMRAKILAPLHMYHSTLERKDVDPQQMSGSYLAYRENEEFELRSLPAGNLHSTVLDMSLFINMVLAEGYPILAPASFAQMTQVQTSHTRYDSDVQFGLNWVLNRPGFSYLGPVLWHNGGTINFMSSLVILPQQKLGAIVFSNSARSIQFVDETMTKILTHAAKIKHGLEPPTKKISKVVALPAVLAAQSAGTYATLLGPARISQKGQKLCVTLGNKKFALHYHADGWFSLHYKLFACIPVPIPELSKVKIQIRQQEGQKIILVKEDEAMSLGGLAVPLKPIPAVWQNLLGEYRIEYPEDDHQWISQAQLREDEGFLILSLKFAQLGKVEFVLSPIADAKSPMAVTAGLGRGLQETVYVDLSKASPRLMYSGYSFIKQA